MPRYESPYDPASVPRNLEHVIYAKKDHVAYVTINRPDVLNALHSYAYAELRACWRDMQLDPDVYCGIVTGAGKAFCAGRDVKFLAEHQAKGIRTPHEVQYASSELALTIYSRYRLGPTLRWHLHLLGQLLGEFYVAKRREEKLRQSSYLQAVHETGARMTHDIKNLLQSLSVLTSVAAREGTDREQLQALLRRQLVSAWQEGDRGRQFGGADYREVESRPGPGRRGEPFGGGLEGLHQSQLVEHSRSEVVDNAAASRLELCPRPSLPPSMSSMSGISTVCAP